MGSLPILKPREIVQLLELISFVEVRQRGSHKQFRHPDGRCTTVPFHAGRDISPILLRQIARDIDLSVEELLKYSDKLEQQPSYIKTILFSTVQKLSTTFSDDIGNQKTGNGTGFWLQAKSGKEYFVTNRHNVDPTMSCELTKSYTFKSITICLRAYDLRNALPQGDIKQYTCSASELKIHWPFDKSDVVLLEPITTMLIPRDPNHKLISLPEELITYSRRPEIFELLYFMGFPGKDRKDAAYDFPVVRSCSIASFPEIDYSLEDKTIPTSQTCLVEGLSFGGSSGSPIMRINKQHVELMGIMSGHFNEAGEAEKHSGLSYFTKADSIKRIIQDNKL